ncbi:MAG: type II secretion system protein GspD [Verrucomicrobia bacterium]|nr:type II secretion system protein GspD [Verrucomicrobiota bacterium]
MSRTRTSTRGLSRFMAATVFCASAVACLGGVPGAAAPPGPAPAAGQKPAEDGIISFNFDQVDVGTFVKLVSDITKKRFVMGEGVKGKITVVSAPVNHKDVYPLFVSILESSGFSVVQDGELHRIVAVPKRDTESTPVLGPDEPTPKQGLITKILRMTNVSAGEVRRALESKVGGGKTGSLAAIEETNHILVTDTAENVRRIEKIVAEIDKPGQSRMTEVLSLQFAVADEIASQLNIAMAESESRAEQLKNRLPAVAGTGAGYRRSGGVVAAPHSNSLILVGTPSQIEEFRKMIKLMDVDSPAGRTRLNAVFLKYISAEACAKSINSLLMKSSGFMAGPKGELSGAGKMRIAIEADPANNALLVDGSPSDFDSLKKLITQLDLPPQQVHITVIIAEVSASTNYNLGVEMAAVDMPGKVGDTAMQGSLRLGDSTSESLMSSIQQGVFPRGLSVGLAQGIGLDAQGGVTVSHPGAINIDALKKIGKVNIRSSTSLEAQNNKEATVNIVNQIPILKSTVSAGSGTARDIIQNIERMDVGIKLKLTPHIIPGGEVQMELAPSIEAVIDPGPAGTQYTPTIAKRDVTTTVTVPDGKMIIIAGLTREDTTKMVKKIPVLGSIPLLGLLFRHTVETSEKTDMIIFVTPKIVSEISAAEKVMEDMQKSTGIRANENR